MLPAHKSVIPNREHREGIRPLPGGFHRNNNIRFTGVMEHNSLGFRKGLGCLQIVSVFRCPLVFHCLRGLHHLLFQGIRQRPVVTLEKFNCPLQSPAVILRRCQSCAYSPALAYVIIEARPEALCKGKSAASFQGEGGVQKINNHVHGTGIAVGTEIDSSILFHKPCLHNSRPLLSRNLDVGVGLVITKKHIVFRPVLFYQVALQNESLHLG